MKVGEASDKFRHYGPEDGLGFSSVTDIKQDDLGFLWISGQDGLSRYDGYKFKLLKKIPRNEESLIDNFIWQITSDDSNGLWIASRTGFSHFDAGTGKFSNRASYQGIASSEQAVTAIALNQNKQLWLGTRGEGLQLFDTQTHELSLIKKTPFLPGDYINTILVGDNKIWLGSGPIFLRDQGRAGLVSYDIQTDSFKAFPVPFSSGVSKLLRSSKGHLWVATFGDGLWKFDTTHQNFIPISSIPNKEIISLYEDKKQNLWIGTSSGLFRLTNSLVSAIGADAQLGAGPGSRLISAINEDLSGNLWIGTWTDGLYQMELFENGIQTLEHSSNTNSILSNEVVSMTTTDDNELWVGLWRNGIDRFNSKGDKIAHYQHDISDPNSLTPGNVRQLLVDHKKQLWISTSQGLNKYNPQQGNFTQFTYEKEDSEGLCGSKIISLSSSKNGLWIGTRGEGACFLPNTSSHFIHYPAQTNSENHLTHSGVGVILPDENGIWMGTEGGGLNYLNRTTQKFTHYSKNNPNYFVSHNNITSLLKDTKDQLWVGTQGGGISILHKDKNNSNFKYKTSITSLDGLSSNAIASMFEDQKGNIWVGTSKGLSKIEPQSLKITVYESDFIFLIGSKHKSSDGTLYFGGIKGLKYFHPDDIRLNEYIPPIALTEFRLTNKILKPSENGPLKSTIELTSNITIPYQKNMFTVSFSALDYRAPELNKYKHRLQGFDDDWIESNSDRHFATYTNLPSGRYRLQILGSNNDGIWNLEGRQLEITVESAPWATVWAIFGYSLILLLLFTYLIWEYRQRRHMNLAYNKELKDTEERLMLSLWGSSSELWDWNMLTSKIIRTNELPLKILPKNLLNSRAEVLKSFVHEKDIYQLIHAYTQHRSNKTPMFECSYRVRNKAGNWVWVLDKGKIVEWNETGNPIRMSGTLENVDRAKTTEERLKIIAKSLENTTDGIWITDNNFNFLFINKTFSKITGSYDKDILGTEFHFTNINNQNRTFEDYVKRYLLEDGHWQGDIWDLRQNGKQYLQQLNIDCLRDSNNNITHFIGVFSDITHRKDSEKELQNLAKYDRLTSLLNSSEFQIKLEQQINLINKNDNARFALIFLGIDNLSSVNEYFGLHAGDHVLKKIAKRIKDSLSSLETISRFSGDEFVILVPDISNDKLNVNLQNLRRIFAKPIFIEDKEIRVSSSIGVSLFPEHGTDPKVLFENAYTSMSRLKNTIGDGIQYFNESILTKSKMSEVLVNELKGALSNNELQLYFQPRIQLSTGNINSIEILLRWNNPKRGLLTPSKFLPLAEQTSMIHHIGDWIFENARQAQQSDFLKNSGIPLSLRISSQQLRYPGFAEKFSQVFANSSMKHQDLQLIIDESELLNTRLTTKQNLEIIYKLGSKLSLANFGTTNTTLLWLQQRNISSVRISRQLISKLEIDNTTKEMIRALLNLSKSLDITCIADGVETQSQREWLEKNGCSSAVGYFFAKPMSLEKLNQYLNTQT